MKAITEGVLLWEPSQYQIEKAGVSFFMKWLKQEKGLSFGNQKELWEWSVKELESFWESIWSYCKVQSNTPYNQVLESRKMPGAKWFTGTTLNYAEHVFRGGIGNKPAVIAISNWDITVPPSAFLLPARCVITASFPCARRSIKKSHVQAHLEAGLGFPALG